MFYREPRNLYGAVDSDMIPSYLVSFCGFQPVLDTCVVSGELLETRCYLFSCSNHKGVYLVLAITFD